MHIETKILEKFNNNKEYFLEILKLEPDYIYYASDILKDDIDVVLVAIEQNGYLIKNASERLRNNQDIALKAITNNVHGFNFLGKKLMLDLDFISKSFKALKKNKDSSIIELQKILIDIVDIRNDRNIVLEILSQKNNNLSFDYLNKLLNTTKLFVNDEIIMNKAILINPKCFQFLGNSLKNNEEFIFNILNIKNKDSYEIFKFIDEKLKSNKKFIKEMAKENIQILEFIDKDLKNNNKFMLELIRDNILAINYVSYELLNDKKFFFAVFELKDFLLDYYKGDKIEFLKEYEEKVKEKNKFINLNSHDKINLSF